MKCANNALHHAKNLDWIIERLSLEIFQGALKKT